MQQNVDVWIEENLVMMFVTVWTLVLCLRRKPGGSRRIPAPISATATSQPSKRPRWKTVHSRLVRPATQVVQDGARLDL